MKKTLLLVAMAAMMSLTANAQTDLRVLNHMSIGLNLGTPGIGVDAGLSLCRFVDVRAGISYMPPFKYNTTLDFGNVSDGQRAALAYCGKEDLEEKIQSYHNLDVQGKLKLINGKVLFDIYPTKKTMFHFTVGAYFGNNTPGTVYYSSKGAMLAANEGNVCVDKYNNEVIIPAGGEKVSHFGMEMADYTLTPNEKGNASASIKTWAAKPYVGIGVGRAVTRKKRIGCMFEAGVMCWDKPSVWCNGKELTKENVSHNNSKINFINKLCVYPVLNFRISGRLF